MDALTHSGTATGPDFDLDVSIIEVGEVVAGLMRNTDDNCGSTCPAACSSGADRTAVRCCRSAPG